MPTSPEPRDVIAYLRVSTDRQGNSGLGLDAQRSTIQAAAEARGWRVVEWIEDTASGKSLNRAGMQRALELLEDDGPKVLVAAKLDRIARSAIDFLTLVEQAERGGWALVVLDLGVDMTTPSGRMVATIMASVAQFERDMISQRTKAALAEAKRRGTKLGTPMASAPDVVARIVEEREAGASLATIARELNREGVPTAQGGKRWYASSVKAVLDRVQGE